MAIKPDIARRKLAAIEDAIAHLRSWAPFTREGLESDPRLRWAVERGLQIAAEALFDVGNHVLASGFSSPADRYATIPRALVARGVLTQDTATRLQGLAGFRNILVHDYVDIDVDRLIDALDRLGDFEAFVADIVVWLDATDGGP